MASFWKPETCGQTVLPDRSVLIGEKLVENAKIKKFKCDILSNFQTMWSIFKSRFTVINFENSIEITLIQFWLLCLHYRISQSRNNIRQPLQKFTRLSIPIEVEAEVQFFSIRSSPLNCTAVNLLTIFRIGEKLFIYHSIYFPVLSPTDY